jgi:tetratricopeptide (TPR) repeat protein
MAIKPSDPQSGNIDLELARYLKIYSQDPKSRAFAPLGETYRKLGKLDEAINILEDGLKIHPTYASAHVSLGRCYSERGESAKALERFEAAAKYAPDNIMAYKLIAWEHKKLKDETALTQVYQKLLNLSPMDQEAIAFLSQKGLYRAKEVSTPRMKPRIEPPAEKPADVVNPVLAEKLPQVKQAPVISENIEKKLEQKPFSGNGSKKLEFYTMTLAEIYLKQGLKSDAVEIYRVLNTTYPGNKIYSDALARLLKEDLPPVAPIKEPVLAQIPETPPKALDNSALASLNSLLNIIGSRKRKL